MDKQVIIILVIAIIIAAILYYMYSTSADGDDTEDSSDVSEPTPQKTKGEILAEAESESFKNHAGNVEQRLRAQLNKARENYRNYSNNSNKEIKSLLERTRKVSMAQSPFKKKQLDEEIEGFYNEMNKKKVKMTENIKALERRLKKLSGGDNQKEDFENEVIQDAVVNYSAKDIPRATEIYKMTYIPKPSDYFGIRGLPKKTYEKLRETGSSVNKFMPYSVGETTARDLLFSSQGLANNYNI